MPISTTKKIGTLLPQQQPIRLGRNESGSYSEIPFETTDANQWASMVNLFDQAGIQYDAQAGFGKHSATGKYPYNFRNDPATEPPVNLWELISNRVDKSIVDAANPQTAVLIQQDIATLQSFVINSGEKIFSVENPPVADSGYNYGDIDPSKLKWAISSPSPPIGADDSAAAALLLANLIVSGVTSQPVFVPTLRFTVTVNNQYPISASFINSSKIISTNSMYLIYYISNNLFGALPNYTNPSLDASRPVLNYGWLMSPPEVRQVARQKWQIVYNWEYGLWPVALFGYPI